MKAVAFCAVLATALVAASPVPAASEKLSPSYLELRRNLEFNGWETRTSMAYGGDLPAGSAAGVPDATLRQRLDALCGRGEFDSELGRYLTENYRDPGLDRSGRRDGAGFAMRDGKLGVARNFKEMLPRHLMRVRDSLPPPGQARFLRDGETLGGFPADAAAAIRQRGEWLVVLDQLTLEIDRQRMQNPKEFETAYAFGLWTGIKCDFALRGKNVLKDEIEKNGFPAADAGADTQRAFLLLVAASRDPQVTRAALDAARKAPVGAVAPEIVARLEAWAK
ncbi:hypothetical protein [Caulobacter sp. 17J80-11]|uniref:hypothetical protein n=1 Tax=Caulobacter sp. 17J80-11 TaxID=2763502 RepID=UPI001653E8DB|nr:hypothetical protein [Caulobacter sp. 17J80-11]MBC6981563.1 hypothetical protein [Caulobacter sp. 17J80-11]